MPRNFNKYQYETSPRKLEPEYAPKKNTYKGKKSTAKKPEIKKVKSNEKLNNYESIELNEKIMKEIDEILLDKNCIYPIFLKLKAKEIRNNNEIFFEGKNKKEIKENLMKYMQCKLSNQKLKKLREKVVYK